MRQLANAKRMIVRSGHDIHYEKPKYFLRALKKLRKIENLKSRIILICSKGRLIASRYNKALSIKERALGTEHMDTAHSYNSIGITFKKQGDKYMIINNLIPKDKFDTSSFKKLMSLSDNEIDAIVPNLLEWIQDMNWPVSSYIIQVLSCHQCVVEKYLLDLLKPEQKDDEWKRNIIQHLLAKWPSKPDDIRIVTEIKRIAKCPTDGEQSEFVDETANEYLKNHL